MVHIACRDPFGNDKITAASSAESVICCCFSGVCFGTSELKVLCFHVEGGMISRTVDERARNRFKGTVYPQSLDHLVFLEVEEYDCRFCSSCLLASASVGSRCSCLGLGS